MHAEILLNPTFGPWKFLAAADHPDGGKRFQYEEPALRSEISDYCDRWDRPDADSCFRAYRGETAFGWIPTDTTVRTTPDTSPERDRAQRIVLSDSGTGALTAHTPSTSPHRLVRDDCRIRTTNSTIVTGGVYLSQADPTTDEPLGKNTFKVDREWRTLRDEISVLSTDVDDAAHTIAITVSGECDLIVDRITLYPNDHIDKADPK